MDLRIFLKCRITMHIHGNMLSITMDITTIKNCVNHFEVSVIVTVATTQ